MFLLALLCFYNYKRKQKAFGTESKKAKQARKEENVFKIQKKNTMFVLHVLFKTCFC